MAFKQTSTSTGGEFRPAKYVRYTHPEDRDLKENELILKKDESVTGYYVGSYEREGNFGLKYNHVLCTKDNNHIVIPDNSDITKDFLSGRQTIGALTRFTYLGKTPFKTKTGQSAKAVKGLIEQDKDDTVEFEGGQGCEVIVGTVVEKASTQPANNSITSEEIPF